MTRYIILDTETTGLNWQEGDRVFDIGMIEIQDSGDSKELKITDREFHEIIDPEHEISKETIRICKIDPKNVIGKGKFNDIAEEMLSFLLKNKDGLEDKGILVAHNAKFDVGFLDNELQLSGKPTLTEMNFEVIDTVKVAKKLFPGKKANLNYLCENFNIKTEEREKDGHGALLDSKLLGEVFLKLHEECTKKHNKSVSEFMKMQMEDFFGFVKRSLLPSRAKNHTPSAGELDLHKKLLQLLKIKNNW